MPKGSECDKRSAPECRSTLRFSKGSECGRKRVVKGKKTNDAYGSCVPPKKKKKT